MKELFGQDVEANINPVDVDGIAAECGVSVRR